MTIYTVHEPPPRRKANPGDTSRFVFVRDGFYFWGFLLGPLWILVHRLWLVLLFYLIAMGAVQTALWALGVSSGVKLIVGLLISLLVGIEASSLRRWTYARRKWRSHGVVSAADPESAERRFFDGFAPQVPVASLDVAPPAAVLRVPPPGPTDVIGLFPEPEPRPRS